MKNNILFLLLIIFAKPTLANENIAFKDFLKAALDLHPQKQIEAIEKNLAEENEKSGRGRYLPHLSIEAIDSDGFPGSNSLLHVGGIAGSAFRSGPAVDLVLEQTLYDFGRTSSYLEKIKSENELTAAKEAEEKFKLLLRLADVYLSCSLTKQQLKQNEIFLQKIKLISSETSQFITTGQKTEIDKSLTDIEFNEVKLNQDTLISDLATSESLIQMYLQKPNISCETLADQNEKIDLAEFQLQTPQILLSKATIRQAESEADLAKTNQRPELSLLGSYGTMDKSRLVPEKDYSIGVGLIFPLFNGGEDYHREKAQLLKVQLYQQELASLQLELKSQYLKLTEQIKSLRHNLNQIDEDQKLVEKTVNLAQQRYKNLTGQLIDLRDAYHKWIQIMATRNNTLLSLQVAEFNKEILKWDVN